MTSILDRFNNIKAAFIPATVQDVFALRLAQKLGDASIAAHYAALVVEHTEARLLLAFRRAIKSSHPSDAAKRFHLELAKVSSHGHDTYSQSLISLRIERRAVAAAVFRGEHLEYTECKQLSSTRERALTSATSFVNWLLARFPVESAVLEAIPNGFQFQRRLLHDGICQTLREHSLPLWEIPKPVLLNTYGHPTLKSREQLRAVATSIWPVLDGKRAKFFLQDAAILGLHAQIERHFIIN